MYSTIYCSPVFFLIRIVFRLTVTLIWKLRTLKICCLVFNYSSPKWQLPPVLLQLPWCCMVLVYINNSQGGTAGGTATQMILQQNSVLEKKISELEAEKEKLEQKLKESAAKHAETSDSLNRELEELRAKVGDLETKLKEKERDISSAESR